MSYSNVISRAAGLLGALIAAQSMAAAPDESVCRDYPRPGSRMIMHVCVTQAEWTAMRARDAAFQTASSAALQGATGNATVTPSVSTSLQRY
jgi:hypothetical protein